ncbi:hypothetical protein QUF90_10800 [Desulfococcaceae bacterium HSG9]|nr:hypothetical protein [Desulfococcaceae bacterium HSG9]
MTPIAGASIMFTPAAGATCGSAWPFPVPTPWIGTDALGYYNSIDLPAGTYYVNADWDNSGTSPWYMQDWYDGENSVLYNSCDYSVFPAVLMAKTITVTAGEVTSGIDFKLTRAGKVSGNVRNTSGPIQGVCIDFYDACDGNWLSVMGTPASTSWNQTDASGDYEVFVPIGTVYAKTNVGCANLNLTVNEYYSTSGDAYGCYSATPVTVTDGGTTTGIDFDLAMGNFIGGGVFDDDTPDDPIAGIEVSIYDSKCGTNPIWKQTTDENGGWGVLVPPGTYYALCGQYDDPKLYYPEWYTDIFSTDNPGTTDCNLANSIDATTGGHEHVTFLMTAIPPSPPGPASVGNVILMSSGPFVAGYVMEFAVHLSQLVFVKGTPQLVLNIGGVPAMAYYSSGSGTEILTFQYTVVAGDDISSLGYWSEWALDLNGGQIYNNYGIDIDLDMPVPGASGSLGANTTLSVLSTVYPMYRFYSAVLLKHLFTADENEKNHLLATAAHIWTLEKSTYNVFLPHQYNAATQEEKNTLMAVHRFYNAGLQTHHYTVDTNEIAHLIAEAGNIWQNDGAVFYVPVGNPEGAIPVYRLYSETLKVHHYTVDENEKESLNATDLWRYEGISFYAYPPS